jgi:uncharacterized protein (TIGR03067 family)
MRLTQTVCPKCKASLSSKAGIEEGTPITCPKCKQKFDAFAPDQEVDDDFDVVDDEDEAPRKQPLQKDSDNDNQRSKPKKRRSDDDDDRPMAKKSSRDDDLDDDRRRPKKKRKRQEEDDEDLGAFGQLKKNIWVRISVLAVLLGILGVLSYMLFVKQKEENTPAIVKDPEDDLRQPFKPTNSNPNSDTKQPVNDVDRFQGSWTATSATSDGEAYGSQGLKSLRFTISGNRWTYQNLTNAKNSSRSTIDPSKSPAHLDLVDNSIGKSATTFGIYRFVDKDNLEICCNLSDSGERPKEFSAPKGSQFLHIKLKHDTKQPKDSKVKDPKSKDPKSVATDVDRLKGIWRAGSVGYPAEPVSGESSKGVLPTIVTRARQNTLQDLSVTITDDQWTLDDANEADQYTFDASKNPAEIDIVHQDGTTSRGIYRFHSKDKLEVCISLTGSRPKSFTPPSTEQVVRIQFTRIE